MDSEINNCFNQVVNVQTEIKNDLKELKSDLTDMYNMSAEFFNNNLSNQSETKDEKPELERRYNKHLVRLGFVILGVIVAKLFL